MQHHLRHPARQKHLHRREVIRPIRQRIHNPRNRAIDRRPIRTPLAAAIQPHARSPEHAAADSSIRQTPRAAPSRCESPRRSATSLRANTQLQPCAASHAPNASPHPARSADPKAPAQHAAATVPAPPPPPARSPPSPETGTRRPASRTRGTQSPPRSPA